MTGETGSKRAQLNRLRRIEGQVRGIAAMVEQDTYCIDVLTQVAAASRALQAMALGLLEEHMSHCLVAAARAGGDEQEAKLKEASAAIARLVRS
ncbi:metal-sensitive transcriptional regulator [Pengzhenrongella frigida]|uniref:Metal-sensitive transcriptional regulator n=1 Tax=Pengzhenrongella frigida TaxID=1259133 RepID=A0A4Q5MVZ1_9MICO|nr:metal-sensitive transcriptional regulator [Cellulomonas sp. HLT2-17]RYV49689.1 metal-sensitive transcriptional regulator [Cellulomonas sp. HLT2-17]